MGRLSIPKRKFELTTFFKTKVGKTTTFVSEARAREAATKFNKRGTSFVLDKIVRTPKGGLTGRAIVRRASKFGLGKNIGKIKR